MTIDQFAEAEGLTLAVNDAGDQPPPDKRFIVWFRGVSCPGNVRGERFVEGVGPTLAVAKSAFTAAISGKQLRFDPGPTGDSSRNFRAPSLE